MDDYLKPLGRRPNLAAALVHLHTSKTIRYVEVMEAGIAALKHALPGCEVKK
jgi:hypothetical protein